MRDPDKRRRDKGAMEEMKRICKEMERDAEGCRRDGERDETGEERGGDDTGEGIEEKIAEGSVFEQRRA